MNDYHRQSSAYVIIQPSLLWLSFSRKCCEWRVLFCEPFKACHLQGPRSHQRSSCCATCFSKKFIHNHNTSSSTSLHAFHKVFLQTTSLSIYLFINLTLLIWHQCRPHPLTSCHSLGPLWSSPSECNSRLKRGHPTQIVEERLRLD